MYFLIKELDRLFQETTSEMRTQTEFRSELHNAWEGLDSAEKDLIDEEDKMKRVQNDFEKKQQELDELKKNRKNAILDKLSNL